MIDNRLKIIFISTIFLFNVLHANVGNCLSPRHHKKELLRLLKEKQDVLSYFEVASRISGTMIYPASGADWRAIVNVAEMFPLIHTIVYLDKGYHSGYPDNTVQENDYSPSEEELSIHQIPFSKVKKFIDLAGAPLYNQRMWEQEGLFLKEKESDSHFKIEMKNKGRNRTVDFYVISSDARFFNLKTIIPNESISYVHINLPGHLGFLKDNPRFLFNMLDQIQVGGAYGGVIFNFFPILEEELLGFKEGGGFRVKHKLSVMTFQLFEKLVRIDRVFENLDYIASYYSTETWTNEHTVLFWTTVRELQDVLPVQLAKISTKSLMENFLAKRDRLGSKDDMPLWNLFSRQSVGFSA